LQDVFPLYGQVALVVVFEHHTCQVVHAFVYIVRVLDPVVVLRERVVHGGAELEVLREVLQQVISLRRFQEVPAVERGRFLIRKLVPKGEHLRVPEPLVVEVVLPGLRDRLQVQIPRRHELLDEQVNLLGLQMRAQQTAALLNLAADPPNIVVQLGHTHF